MRHILNWLGLSPDEALDLAVGIAAALLVLAALLWLLLTSPR